MLLIFNKASPLSSLIPAVERGPWRTKKKRLHHPADAGQEDEWQGRLLRQGFGNHHHRGSELGRPIVFVAPSQSMRADEYHQTLLEKEENLVQLIIAVSKSPCI